MKKLLLSITFLSFLFLGNKTIYAQPVPGGGPSPVISEIMYNPPEGGNDTLEFVEIMNPSLTSSINMTGFYIEDAFDFTFPDGFILGTGEFVLISGDSVVFEESYGVESFEWEGATTQLSNGGESITLRNGANAIVDTVFYDNTSAWVDADGTGFSLVLCDPSSDNNLPESWTLSENATGLTVNALEVFADPGQASTCTLTGIDEEASSSLRVFPNPSNGIFQLSLEPLDEASTLRIFNTLGQAVFTKAVAKGTSTLELETDLQRGHYILSVDGVSGSNKVRLIIN